MWDLLIKRYKIYFYVCMLIFILFFYKYFLIFVSKEKKKFVRFLCCFYGGI